MKVTIEVPDPLYRELKVRAAAEGRTVREITIEAYGRYLTQVAAPPVDPDQAARAEAWLAEWDAFWDEFAGEPKSDPRSALQILLDDRRARDR